MSRDVQDMDVDTDSPPTSSGPSAGSLPTRKRARKPSHVYNASEGYRSDSPPRQVRARTVRLCPDLAVVACSVAVAHLLSQAAT